MEILDTQAKFLQVTENLTVEQLAAIQLYTYVKSTPGAELPNNNEFYEVGVGSRGIISSCGRDFVVKDYIQYGLNEEDVFTEIEVLQALRRHYLDGKLCIRPVNPIVAVYNEYYAGLVLEKVEGVTAGRLIGIASELGIKTEMENIIIQIVKRVEKDLFSLQNNFDAEVQQALFWKNLATDKYICNITPTDYQTWSRKIMFQLNIAEIEEIIECIYLEKEVNLFNKAVLLFPG